MAAHYRISLSRSHVFFGCLITDQPTQSTIDIDIVVGVSIVLLAGVYCRL